GRGCSASHCRTSRRRGSSSPGSSKSMAGPSVGSPAMPTDQWNFADVWEVVADTRPDAPATIQGERRNTCAEHDRRADAVAQALLDAGVVQQDKVAQYLYNCPEYLESVFATMKAG